MHFSESDLVHLQSALSDKKSWIKLIDAAIGTALNNSLVLKNAQEGRGFDIVAYMDSLYCLSEALDEDFFYEGSLKPCMLSGTCVCHWQLDEGINQELSDGLLLANRSIVVLNLCAAGEDFAKLKRMMGFHNVSSNQFMYADKKLNIIIPFEMVTVLEKRLLPREDIPASFMFALEPNNPVFMTSLTPAAVSGVVLDNNMPTLQAFVTHPNILHQELMANDAWRDERYGGARDEDIRLALHWDTQLALMQLKHRYLLDINDEYIDRVGDMNNRIKQFHDEHGAAVLEL